PSGTKRELASLLTRRMTDAGASAAGTLVCAAGHDPAIATANNAAFFSVDCAIVVPLFVVSSRVSYGSDAKPDQVDAAAVVLRFVDCDFLAFEIDNAAQNENELPHQLRSRQCLGLGRRYFERGRSSHDHALAVLFFDRLVDRQNAQIG